MPRSDTLAAISPLLRHRNLRVVLVAAPGVMAAVAVLTAAEISLAGAVVLNAAAGVIVSSVLFLAVSIVARRVADERVGFVRAADEALWRARSQLFSIHNPDTGLYTDWYFRLRLEEEIERSRRYDLHFAVLLMRPSAAPQDAAVSGTWFGENLRRHLRTSDLPALLKDGNLAVIMPSASRRAAVVVRRRLSAEPAASQPKSGLACFPEDAQDASGLLSVAAREANGEPSRKRRAAPSARGLATA